MNDLIERIEAASGPDRDLDVAILTTVLGYRDIFDDGSLFDKGNDGYWSLDGDEKNARLPAPTASIDAALTLVPTYWNWSMQFSAWEAEIDQRCGPNEYMARLVYRGRKHISVGSDASTPALALCAAALKSRAYLKETNNGQ